MIYEFLEIKLLN